MRPTLATLLRVHGSGIVFADEPPRPSGVSTHAIKPTTAADAIPTVAVSITQQGETMNAPATPTKDWATTYLAAALVLGPLGLLAASLALPSVDEKAAAFAHPAAYMIWVLAGTIGSGFWLYGYTGLAARIGNKFPVLGVISTIVVFMGGTFATMDMGTELVKRQIGVSSLDHHFLSAFWDQLETAPGITGPLQVGGIGSLIGVILLAIGIFRAKLAPAWVPVAMVVGIFLAIAGFMVSTYVLDVGNALMLVVGTIIARRLISDDPAGLTDVSGRPVGAELSQPPLPAT